MRKSQAIAGLSVSLVVPSYQGSKNLRRLFHALEQQRVECDWEVVVVLDGSTDDSAQICAEYSAKLPLRTIKRLVNLGRSQTLNEGFAVASKRVLVRCDDDFEPDPLFVQRFSDIFTKNANQGIVGICENQFEPGKYGKKYGEPSDKRFSDAAFKCAAEDRWQYWAGNCAVTRELFDKVGEYDTRFRGYGWEDVDWGYRLSRLGVPINIPTNFRVLHYLAAVNAAKRCERAKWSGMAAVKFHAKHRITRQAPSRITLWNILVNLVTPIAGKNLGRMADLLLLILPAKIAAKFIDLAVEASFNNGYSQAKKKP